VGLKSSSLAKITFATTNIYFRQLNKSKIEIFKKESANQLTNSPLPSRCGEWRGGCEQLNEEARTRRKQKAYL